MKKNIIFFANTLWFLNKFKYELIKDISKDKKITCIYLRKGPTCDTRKINNLKSIHGVKFIHFKNFFINYSYSIIHSFFKFKRENLIYEKIIIFTIGPILISLLFPNFYKKKTVYVLEGLGRVFSSTKTINKLLKKFIIRIYRFLFNKCNIVFVLNYDDYLYLLENKICKINKVKVLPGTGINHLKIEKSFSGKRKDKKYIDYIGRIIIEKGFYKFILTSLNFKKFYPELDEQYTFRIISPKEDIENLSKDEINFLIKNNIVIKPYLIEPFSYYEESKALIVPSTYGEGLSRVVLEASYIGIPILANKIRGIVEILPNDYRYFIESNNPFSIAQQLAEMINDDEYFNSIKKALKRNIEKNYSVEKSIIEFNANVFKS